MASTRDLARAEWDCAQALLRFVGHLDRREYEALLALATPDCVWHGKTTARGHAEIRTRLEARPPGIETLHVLSNMVIAMRDAWTAEVRSYLTVYRFEAREGPPPTAAPPHSLGIYDDRLVRTDAGWKVAERRLTILAGAAG